MTPLDLPRFVGRLIDAMRSPDQPGNGGVGRPDVEDVQRSIADLRIASGPADVTAFHDYHNLQIAFDYVWKQLLDEGVLETGKALAQTIADAGGDPLAALEGAGDPIAALKRETQYIARPTIPSASSCRTGWATGDRGRRLRRTALSGAGAVAVAVAAVAAAEVAAGRGGRWRQAPAAMRLVGPTTDAARAGARAIRTSSSRSSRTC